jgi:hypothetical protein
MKGILVAIEKLAHWSSILPVLRWLERAGVDVRAQYEGARPPGRALATMARDLDLEAPRIRWTRRGGRPNQRLLVGTTADLPLLRLRNQPFLALPRLPLPAVLLGPGVQSRLLRAAADSQQSPAGRLLDGEDDAPFSGLLGGTEGLPYILTGLPELDRPQDRLAKRALVILHRWDLSASGYMRGHRNRLLEQASALESLLAPLIPTSLQLEVRSTTGQLSERDAIGLQEMWRWICEQRGFPEGRLQIARETDWAGLPRELGVLVLSPEILVSGFVAGVERIWWLPYALHSSMESPPKQPIISSCVLAKKEELARWAANRGWEQSPRGAETVVGLLRPYHDGHASERVAQVVLAGLEN